MNHYTEQISRILKEQSVKQMDGQPKTAMILNFAKPQHLDCIFAQYGGEDNLKKKYPNLYQVIQHTNQAHMDSESEGFLKQVPGLNDSLDIYDMACQNKISYAYGAVTLTTGASRLYVSLSLYDDDTCIASDSDFFHNISRATLECKSDEKTMLGRHLKAILHVTWQPQDSNILTSAALEMTQVIASVDPVAEVTVSHPRLNPGQLPDPIPDEGVKWNAVKLAETLKSEAQEFINICYARSPLSGERCDYLYPNGLKNGKQNIYLDVRGEVKLDSGWEYDKLIYADAGINMQGGNAVHQLNLTEKFITKTSTGFTYAFPTDWHTPIPGSKLAGHELAFMSVKIAFRCKDSTDDYIVFIKSYVTENQEITHSVTMPSLKMNWGCVAEDTRVKMVDGSEKLIKDIKIGEQVRTGAGNASAIVSNIIKGYENILWDVQAFDKDIIRTTGTHPFLTRNGIKMAEDLIETDELLMEDGTYVLIKYRFEQYYGKTVYNLMLNDANSFIGNGYVIGDNVQQGDCMRAADREKKRYESPHIMEEISQLKKEFMRKR